MLRRLSVREYINAVVYYSSYFDANHFYLLKVPPTALAQDYCAAIVDITSAF